MSARELDADAGGRRGDGCREEEVDESVVLR
jgi:hypothetical protein